MGFLVKLLAARSDAAEAKADRERDERLSERGHLVELRRAEAEIARMAPMTFTDELVRKRPMFLLFGPAVEYSRKRTRQKLPQSARSRTVSRMVMLFCSTYCLVVLVFLFNVDTSFQAIDPHATPREFNLLLFKFKWMPKDTFTLSGGGAILYLLSPISFILTTVATGRTFQRGKDRS